MISLAYSYGQSVMIIHKGLYRIGQGLGAVQAQCYGYALAANRLSRICGKLASAPPQRWRAVPNSQGRRAAGRVAAGSKLLQVLDHFEYSNLMLLSFKSKQQQERAISAARKSIC